MFSRFVHYAVPFHHIFLIMSFFSPRVDCLRHSQKLIFYNNIRVIRAHPRSSALHKSLPPPHHFFILSFQGCRKLTCNNYLPLRARWNIVSNKGRQHIAFATCADCCQIVLKNNPLDLWQKKRCTMFFKTIKNINHKLLFPFNFCSTDPEQLSVHMFKASFSEATEGKKL